MRQAHARVRARAPRRAARHRAASCQPAVRPPDRGQQQQQQQQRWQWQRWCEFRCTCRGAPAVGEREDEGEEGGEGEEEGVGGERGRVAGTQRQGPHDGRVCERLRDEECERGAREDQVRAVCVQRRVPRDTRLAGEAPLVRGVAAGRQHGLRALRVGEDVQQRLRQQRVRGRGGGSQHRPRHVRQQPWERVRPFLHCHAAIGTIARRRGQGCKAEGSCQGAGGRAVAAAAVLAGGAAREQR